MANRTQIVCLHEGKKGRSIDPVFINALIQGLKPAWIRPWKGSNLVRLVDGGGRSDLIKRMPAELRACLQAGGNTTLMVWADLDHDMANGDHLKAEFRKAAGAADLAESDFDRAVFIFAKDRLENWIQYLTSGGTDETIEGPRVKNNKEVAKAARKLAEMCLRQVSDPPLPDSLAWSCHNWKKLVKRMKDA